MINIKNPSNRLSFYILFVINYFKGLLFTLNNSVYKNNSIVITYPKKLFPFHHRALFYDKKYEEDEFILCNKYISKHDVVLELGACLGFISCTINNIL